MSPHYHNFVIQVNLGFMLMAMQIMYKHRDTAKSKKDSLWYVCMYV